MRERRQTSPVSDGLDVAAQLQVMIVPAEGTSRLDESDLTELVLNPTAESTRLSHVSKEGGWNSSTIAIGTFIAIKKTWRPPFCGGSNRAR